MICPPEGIGTPRNEARAPADLFHTELCAVALHILVDEQRLTAANNLRRKPGTEGSRWSILAEGVGKLQHHRRAVQQRDVGDRRTEEVAHLIADKADEAVLVQLGGQRLAYAVDGHQLGGALADLVFALIDDEIGVGIIESDGGIGSKIFKQAQVLLGIGILLEALHTSVRRARVPVR